MNGVLERLGLGRPDLRAWAMYDWANSAFYTTIIAAIFPIYFQKVAAANLPGSVATSRFAWGSALSIFLVATITPVLGTFADARPIKKRMIGVFLAIGALATAAMWFISRGEWMFALTLFIAGNVGVAGSIVFYEALLPHLAAPEELDRVSAAGYAVGYIGGGLLLAVNIAMMMHPGWFGLADKDAAVRASLASVAVWWVVFSIPLFRSVPEPAIGHGENRHGLHGGHGSNGVMQTLAELTRYRQALLMLLAFLIYNDGIQTIIRMATIYGTEIGLDDNAMIGALIVTQFIGIPFAFLFGFYAEKVGARPAIFTGIGAYAVISLLGYFMRTSIQFFALAVMVGMVQGGTQAISRSLFASLIPKAKSSEFFAFFGVCDRYAGVLGPALFAWVVSHSGTSRNAILSVIAFFIVGAIVLAFVDVDEGRLAARAANRPVV